MGEEVTVTVEDNDADNVEDTPAVVVAPVIVNDGGDGSEGGDAESNDLAMTVGALAATVAALTEKVDALTVQQETTAIVADAALDTALDTSAEVAEVAEETDVDIEPDNEPNKLPWTHRNFFGRNE